MTSDNPTFTIQQAMDRYLQTVERARSNNTARTYRFALARFRETLENHSLPPVETPVTQLPEEALAWLAEDLSDCTSATERLYLTAAAGFYKFLVAENLASPNLPRLKLLIDQHGRQPTIRLPQFPRDEIEHLCEYAESLITAPARNQAVRLRNLRDRALILTLADTGLRIHEACGLTRGDLDWNEGRAIITGKGDRQDVVRFSSRALRALRDYLRERATLDGSIGRPLPTLPLFAGRGKRLKPLSTHSARYIIDRRVREALGEEAALRITPHSFRHYFVTTVLLATGNLKVAQELARHRRISVTQRYAHISDAELDQHYWEVFEEREHLSSKP